MATFLTLQEKAKKLTPTKVKSDLFTFIKTLEEELIAYNVATLHQDSEDIDGKPIGFYSYATELITNGRKKAGEPFDLLESGKFLDNVFAKVENNSIFFDTKDNKKQEVVKNLLSVNIFGLQDDDLNKIIETKLLPFMQNYYLKELLQ